MGAAVMSDDLPPGFVTGQPPQAAADSDLPPGFVAGQPPEKKFGLGDTWPARLAKSLYSAVTLPGDVMQGKVQMAALGSRPESGPAPTAPNENSTMLGRALNIPPAAANPMDDIIGRTLDLASAGSPISPAARLGIGWAGALKTEKAPAPTPEALAARSDDLYTQARNLGVELPASNIAGFADKVANKLLNDHGITPEQALNTYKTLDRLRDAPADATVTVPNLDAIRQNFGATAGNFNPAAAQDQFAAILAKQHLADHVASLTDEDAIRGPASQLAAITKEANGNYSALKTDEAIGDSLQKAELQIAATHSGRNLDNKTRQSFVKFLTNDKIGAGLRQPELDAAESIIRGSKAADLARSAGNFLGGGGGMGMLHGSAAGAAAGSTFGPIGAAVGAVVPPAVGYGLKKLADASTMNKVDALREMVRGRSPLGQSMPDRIAGSVSPTKALLARDAVTQAMLARGVSPPSPASQSHAAVVKALLAQQNRN